MNNASPLPPPTLPQHFQKSPAAMPPQVPQTLRENPSFSVPTGPAPTAAPPPLKKTPSIPVVFGVLILMVTLIGGGVGFYLTQQSQETRQQAAGACGDQAPVNAQFRMTSNNKTVPWIDGTAMTQLKPEVGEKVDVNCFSKNGLATLTQGSVYVILPGSTAETKISSGPSVDGYTLSKAGTYKFVCRSSAASLSTCTNTDQFVAIAAAASPSPSPSASVSPSPSTTPRVTPTPSATPRITPTPTTTPKVTPTATPKATAVPTTTPSTVRTTAPDNGPTPVSGSTETTFGVLIAGILFIVGGKYLFDRRDFEN